MQSIPDAMLRDMKRACFQYDCYKCRHRKETAEEMEPCREILECEHCRIPCPCRTCDEGSSWEWEPDCTKPLTWDEVQDLKEIDCVWIETRSGRRVEAQSWQAKRANITLRRYGGPPDPEYDILLTCGNYGKEWRCWREEPTKEESEAAAWS